MTGKYLIVSDVLSGILKSVILERWKLVFAGSCFITPSESWYSLTEGELLVVAWALDNAKLFVLGCQNLTVATDYKPLLGILDNCKFKDISNPCIFSLRFTFNTKHCTGKWHRGADAVSWNPTITASDTSSYPIEPRVVNILSTDHTVITLEQIQHESPLRQCMPNLDFYH